MQTFSLKTSYKKLLADTITPVSIYLKLRDQFPNSLLLESSDYHSRENSYSYICCDPIANFKVENQTIVEQLPDGSTIKTAIDASTDVVAQLQNFATRFKDEDLGFKFVTNGLFGYMTYDAVQYFEDIDIQAERVAHKAIPDLQYSVFKFIIVIDHYKNELYLLEHQCVDFPQDGISIDSVKSLIQNRNFASYQFQTVGTEGSNMDDAAYRALVTKGKAHCQRGDVFQIVLAREFGQAFQGDEFNVYRALRAVNPSPYLFYFDYGNFKIFGSSPEAQLVIHNQVATINPIAGTYKRTGKTDEDHALAQALKADKKEQAEHVMLVDLARNDLSRNAEAVEVQTFSEIQYYSHVIHMVSKVTGQLSDTNETARMVADTFPAGTLSGAPKYKAMQLIDQYEPNQRSFYGGALGYMGFAGDFNHAIVIRSFLSKNNRLTYQAGAGVVTGSQEENELQEVNNKIAALRKAIQAATEIV